MLKKMFSERILYFYVSTICLFFGTTLLITSLNQKSVKWESFATNSREYSGLSKCSDARANPYVRCFIS